MSASTQHLCVASAIKLLADGPAEARHMAEQRCINRQRMLHPSTDTKYTFEDGSVLIYQQGRNTSEAAVTAWLGTLEEVTKEQG